MNFECTRDVDCLVSTDNVISGSYDFGKKLQIFQEGLYSANFDSRIGGKNTPMLARTVITKLGQQEDLKGTSSVQTNLKVIGDVIMQRSCDLGKTL